MKFLPILLTTILVMLACLFLLTSCSHNNFEEVAPTTPTESSSAQQHLAAAASPIEAAILASRSNNNFSPYKFSSAHRISATSFVAAPIYAVTDLGTFSGRSLAAGINSSGQIVGYSYTADNRQHAFLYSAGVMQDLNELIPVDSGLELISAGIITDDGQITARGLINGEGPHAVLLKPSPSHMIGNLVDLVRSFNLPKGIENSLIVKLEHAQAAINAGDISDAWNQLNAFINEVNVQAGKKLTLDQANQLISGANQIKTALGCQ